METKYSNGNATESNALDEPKLEIDVSRQFLNWLAEYNSSLLFTTYQRNRLFLIGRKADDQISVFQRLFPRCMSVYVHDNAFYLSTLYQLWRFENCLLPGELFEQQYDRLYIPQVAYTTGDLDIHDMVVDNAGNLIFVSALFSCLATVSETHSFKPIWTPPFITKLAAEDRCHLNGLAIREGVPRYVSMISQTDVHAGWREHRRDGGIIMDITTNDIVCSGLSMPHSPRWYRDKLWLLNSGQGEFGYLDHQTGQFNPIAFCPGYARGLSFIGDFAVIGLSKPRDKTFAGLALDDVLKSKNIQSRCGVQVVNLKTGDVVHSLAIEGAINEVYEVALLPNVKCPAAVGTANDQIRRMMSIDQ